MDSFGKIIAILISALLMFITPILYLAQKQDAISQNYVTMETKKLVDTIKNNGYLKESEYDIFLKKLFKTGNSYRIEIEHGKETVYPVTDDDGTYQDDISVNYLCVYEKDILDELYDTGIYYFHQGDYISVSITNQNKTFAARLMQIIFANEMPAEQIYVTYGGFIRDENY